jgi:ABC-type glycerol-3-phosphate transport system substrate-binding protein
VRHVQVLAAACLLAVSGCGDDPNRSTGPVARPFADVPLTVSCPDPEFAAAATPVVNSWAARTGARVTVRTGPMAPGDDADVGIIPAAEFGTWAGRDDLAPVPPALRASDHPFQWAGVLPAYREHLIEWGGQARAVPLAGEGAVVVYRADRLADPQFVAAFRKAHGRDPAAPASWEDFAALAAAFADLDRKPSLPALSGPEAADLFFRVAACFDRQSATETTAKTGPGLGSVSFLHDVQTGGSRLGAPAFAAAAAWLGSLPGAPAGSADPVAALVKEDAALAVLTLPQLAKLPREGGRVPDRFGVAPLPGTRQFFDPEKKQLVPAGTPNYVPFYSGGRLGVVRSRCAKPDAAFDLLAELGGPTRSLELLGVPGLGAGPFRQAHLERDRIAAWLGYGFDAERSRALQEALRQYARPEVRNPAYGLRGPDQGPLLAAAADAMGKVAAGAVPPDAGLKELIAAWGRIDEKTPAETRLRWRRLSAGVN